MGIIIIGIIIFAFAMCLSWLLTIGIIKLITICFGLTFSLLTATGIWLVLLLISSFIGGCTTINNK